ncbi:GntG family PLP-dependent aldolase [Enhygromyxa salina]|uniref:L-allo-threonine aldolase n=1 Tax=Enhygromyxa salina TaxID=215803 RepID=A0A2S9YKN2_9BACT|nr:GntG family PLP-dependent aldolase [Enhygromyxa salina]PRQ05675.1 L-allo-threonine aldolase [Enhygromyxa salina]
MNSTAPINLRSDTQTLPTPAMLQAIASAELGDDTYDADPTVKRFEAMAAAAMGKPAAMLAISGHMANLIALIVHAPAGSEVILDADSHIFHYEVGSLGSVAHLMPWPVASEAGMLDPERVDAAIRERDIHYPTPRLLCLENTHNRSGGRVIPVALHDRLCELARARGLAVHLDGARIFNAAIAAGVSVTTYTAKVDSVMFALTKGLSCPLGSVLAGDGAFIEQARHVRRRLGGGMRQAGIIAAAGIVALETMVDRLAQDHARARLLAEGLAQLPGLSVDMTTVETNMVYVDHAATGRSTEQIIELFAEHGVIASNRPPRHVRLVTNRHHDDATITEAISRIRAAIASIV